MKSLLRLYLMHLLALKVTSGLLHPAFTIKGNIETWAVAGAVLTIFSLLLRPILKLLLFPLNALSLGLFSLVINAGIFYLFVRVVPDVTITSWTFPGFSYSGFTLPQTTLSYVAMLFVTSFIIGLITNFLAYLVK